MNIPTEKPRIRVRAGTAADIRQALNKAADNIADLMDVVDVPVVSDQWNVADHGNKPRTPTGPAEQCRVGVRRTMIEHYSPDQQSGNSIAQAYDAMASQLAFMNTRMAASGSRDREHCIVACAAGWREVLPGRRNRERW